MLGLVPTISTTCSPRQTNFSSHPFSQRRTRNPVGPEPNYTKRTITGLTLAHNGGDHPGVASRHVFRDRRCLGYFEEEACRPQKLRVAQELTVKTCRPERIRISGDRLLKSRNSHKVNAGEFSAGTTARQNPAPFLIGFDKIVFAAKKSRSVAERDSQRAITAYSRRCGCFRGKHRSCSDAVSRCNFPFAVSQERCLLATMGSTSHTRRAEA